jgi:hypothetical protein
MPPLGPIAYTPKFQHLDWVDNVDRVQAGGDHGFNLEFHNLEQEFAALYATILHADAVKQDVDTNMGQVKAQVVDIYTKLAALGTVVTAPVTLGLPPVLLPFRQTVPQWSAVLWRSQTGGGTPLGTYVERPSGTQDQAHGVVPLSLPKGVKLVQLRVLGEMTGGTAPVMTAELIEELRAPPYTPKILASTGFGAAVPVLGTPTVHPDLNLYYIIARLTAAGGATVKLRGFELVYQP